MLPFFPCGDRSECNDEEVKTSVVTKIALEHQSHEHEEENCPPFCSCMCCGQIITNLFYPLKEERSSQTFFSKNTTTYKNAIYSSSYLDKIWQPPKFS